jgi:hypothetical protein
MTSLELKPWYSRSLDPIGILGCLLLLAAMFSWDSEGGKTSIMLLIAGLGLLGINGLRWRHANKKGRTQ